MTERKAKPWKLPMGSTAELRNTAHAHALKYEQRPGFPGVDIDALHYKFGAVKRRKAA